MFWSISNVTANLPIPELLSLSVLIRDVVPILLAIIKLEHHTRELMETSHLNNQDFQGHVVSSVPSLI